MIGDKSKGVAVNGVDEGLVKFGVRVGVEEAKEAEEEDTSHLEVVPLKGKIGVKEERVEPL